MASNKANIRNAQVKADTDLAKDLIKIVAVGVAGGAALIGAASMLGEMLIAGRKEESSDPAETAKDDGADPAAVVHTEN